MNALASYFLPEGMTAQGTPARPPHLTRHASSNMVMKITAFRTLSSFLLFHALIKENKYALFTTELRDVKVEHFPFFPHNSGKQANVSS